jgi:hypothetical protein
MGGPSTWGPPEPTTHNGGSDQTLSRSDDADGRGRAGAGRGADPVTGTQSRTSANWCFRKLKPVSMRRVKIISMHKVDAAMEVGRLPSGELIRGMGQLMGQMRRAGAFVDGAGLRPSATRARVRAAGGKRAALEQGPYGGSNELVERFAMIQVRNMDEAIDWASRQAVAGGDAEVEVGPVTEAWDLGVMAKPADAPLRCLLLQKADAAFEAGQPQAAATAAAQDRVKDDMSKAGVLLAAQRLKPSRQGTRISVKAGQATFRDGPFTESKELIAGYVILELPTLEAARPFALAFAEVIGDVEIELRVLHEGE